MHDIWHIVSHLNVSKKVKNNILAVYKLIAEAESHAHGRPVEEIHFHEVGTMDAVADVTAVCMLIEEISPDKIIASPIHVGSGHVHCAHGILPVPAPATAYILKDVPIYGGSINGELCTPTGAALLKHFVSEFGNMPVMKISAVGYGMGKKDFERANCVRAMLGETEDKVQQMYELSCNVDDMSAEEIAFATERLLAAGARDVWTQPLGMKKNRPGTMICVLCDPDESDRLAAELFRYTTTLGIRKEETERYVLSRSETVRETKYGQVRSKRSQGYGVVREKLEYEDLARLAGERGVSIREIRRELEEEEA